MEDTFSTDDLGNTGYVELKIFDKEYAFLFGLRSMKLFLYTMGISENDVNQPMLEKLLFDNLHIYLWAAAEIAAIWTKRKDNKISVEKIKSWLDSSPPPNEMLKLGKALSKGGNQAKMAGGVAINDKN